MNAHAPRRAAAVSCSAIALAALLTACAAAPPGQDGALVGSWKLVSFETEAQGSSGRMKPMGNAPSGSLTFTRDGRMLVVITAEGRKPASNEQERAALLNSLVAYGGRWRVEGDKFIVAVDLAANPAVVGGEQSRTYKITGDSMQESSDWIRRPDNSLVRVFTTYERVK